jgi:TolB protein
MDVEGGNRKHITDGDLYPIYSPDGNWIVYSDPKEQWSLWKILSDGGGPIRLTDHPAYNPAVSPDGKWIAYQTRGHGGEPVLRIIPFDGGEAVRSYVTGQNPAWSHTEWTPDGKSITYQTANNGIDQIVNQPIDGGQPQVLVSLKTESESIRGFAWSRDGRRLFFAAGPVIRNVVMFDLVR